MAEVSSSRASEEELASLMREHERDKTVLEVQWKGEVKQLRETQKKTYHQWIDGAYQEMTSSGGRGQLYYSHHVIHYFEQIQVNSLTWFKARGIYINTLIVCVCVCVCVCRVGDGDDVFSVTGEEGGGGGGEGEFQQATSLEESFTIHLGI